MIERFATLRRYAQSTKVDAILFTCSAFGLEIDTFKRDSDSLSMLKLNEAMLEEAVETWNRIGMLATFSFGQACSRWKRSSTRSEAALLLRRSVQKPGT